MRLAIMQPYLFPYLGYFQLLHAVDKLVIYDDVTFIRQGWINRNRLCVNGRSWTFTVPVRNQSSFRAIRETEISEHGNWRESLLKTIELNYRKAPSYDDFFPVVERVLRSEVSNISELASLSVKATSEYIGLPLEIVPTSSVFPNSNLNGVERVLDLCRRLGAKEYVNLPGGRDLYATEDFAREGIRLKFVSMKSHTYSQATPEFIPGLSIIDVLMNVERRQFQPYLTGYDFV